MDKELGLCKARDVFIPVLPLAYSPFPRMAHKKWSPLWGAENIPFCDLSGGHTSVDICKNLLSHTLKIKCTLQHIVDNKKIFF